VSPSIPSYHVNPRYDGIDGDTDLCAAGTAYLVANALGDNRDLAGLTLLGVIGDGQTLTGKNQDIYLGALGTGSSVKRGELFFQAERLPSRLSSQQNHFSMGFPAQKRNPSILFEHQRLMIPFREIYSAHSLFCRPQRGADLKPWIQYGEICGCWNGK